MTPPDHVRPVVYDYGSAPDFFRAISKYLKQTSHFSIRQRTQKLPNCSPALVTQVLNGKRRLTRDQLPAFAKIFSLNPSEFEFLDNNLRGTLWESKEGKSKPRSVKPAREPKNHILSHWLHSYVKDMVHLKNFKADAQVIYRLAYGMASATQIQKSMDFLFREGFWRRSASGKVVPEDEAVLTSNEIPNLKIRNFHKRALKLAILGVDRFPVSRRKSSTVLVSVNKENLTKLRSLVDAFENQLIEFIEAHPVGLDEVVQVSVHMTPVGGNCEK